MARSLDVVKADHIKGGYSLLHDLPYQHGKQVNFAKNVWRHFFE